jgi:hypothetical protein
MKIYHFIYYKLYCYMLNTPNKANAIEGASAILSCISLLYFLAIFICFKSLIRLWFISQGQFYLIFISIGFFNYYLNLKYFKKKIVSIKESFVAENKIQFWLGGIFVLIIGLGSIASVIIAGIFLK